MQHFYYHKHRSISNTFFPKNKSSNLGMLLINKNITFPLQIKASQDSHLQFLIFHGFVNSHIYIRRPVHQEMQDFLSVLTQLSADLKVLVINVLMKCTCTGLIVMSAFFTFLFYVPIMPCGHRLHREPTDNHYISPQFETETMCITKTKL